MYRDHTKVIKNGNRVIGGGNPILIQSMTNTKTEDVEATVAQILSLEKAGCDIIRCAVPTMEAAKALSQIKKQIHIPLVADIHFDYRLAIGKTFPEITDQNVPKMEGYAEKNGVISFFSRGSFSDCGLYLEVPKKEVLSGLSRMRLFLIGIFGAVFVAAVLLALWLSRVVCGPLRSMTGTVEKVGEGDLSLRTEVTTADEIGTLGKEFNHMLDYIEALIAQVIEEEQQKKDAELEALQYQITPHFMYNTLNSIKFAAFLKGEKELAGLIGDFVELLQCDLRDQHDRLFSLLQHLLDQSHINLRLSASGHSEKKCRPWVRLLPFPKDLLCRQKLFLVQTKLHVLLHQAEPLGNAIHFLTFNSYQTFFFKKIKNGNAGSKLFGGIGII